MKIILPILLISLGVAAVDQIAALPRARVTEHVIGEDGNPLQDVKVSFVLGLPSKENPTGTVSGLTDANGNFTGEGEMAGGNLGGEISKEGYYSSAPNIPKFAQFKDGRWQPWDQIYTTVLRGIGKPIPMYARKLAIKIPSGINESCGFDLEKADWVAPYGNGEFADFIITITNAQYRKNNDYELSATISFSNSGDGIQEVQFPKEFAGDYFRWPREAPENGYQPKFEAQNIRLSASTDSANSIQSKNINTSSETQAYFFRVRTAEQGGQISSALYGKIKGGFHVSPDKTQHGFIEFTYYLNPTPNDRNLEWDPTKNLAPTPKDMSQRVREP